MLNKLTAMALTESDNTADRERLRLSLQLDGFEISEGEFSAIQGPISISQEKDQLLISLAASPFARKDLIVKHLKPFDARPCVHDDRYSAQVCDVASDWVYQSKECDSSGTSVRRAEEKCCGAAFLGARVLGINREPRRSRDSRVDPESGARRSAVGSDQLVAINSQ
jgi:hypothetical protein